MTVFNSLGSNYSGQQALTALLAFLGGGHTPELTRLSERLSSVWEGQTLLTYKGRDAITCALQAHSIGAGDQVLTQALSCFAVEEGIVRAGATPVYVDTAPRKLYPTIRELERALRDSPHARAVLLQHTLGVPGPVTKVRTWCAEHQLLLIEDLAQSFGAVDEAGTVLGTHADAVVLSFGRDKVLDAGAGGAVCIPLKHSAERLSNLCLSARVPLRAQAQEAVYPLLTSCIRFTYEFGFGKLLHAAAKRSGILTSPLVSATAQAACMPSHLAPVIHQQLDESVKLLAHRRMVAEYYMGSLSGIVGCELLVSAEQVARGSNLRFPIATERVQDLIRFLRARRVYLHDRWYRSAVDCGNLHCGSVYVPGSCPNAEATARTILNLPTHRGITEREQQHIARSIREFFEG